jgi:hypothetical protein
MRPRSHVNTAQPPSFVIGCQAGFPLRRVPEPPGVRVTLFPAPFRSLHRALAGLLPVPGLWDAVPLWLSCHSVRTRLTRSASAAARPWPFWPDEASGQLR